MKNQKTISMKNQKTINMKNPKTIMILVAFLLVAGVSCGKGDGYRLTGKIEGVTTSIDYETKGYTFSAGYVYLYGAVREGRPASDSAKIENGRFTFTGTTDEPVKASLVCCIEGGMMQLPFFLENSKINLTAELRAGPRGNSFLALKELTGCALHDEYAAAEKVADDASGRTASNQELAAARENGESQEVISQLNRDRMDAARRFSGEMFKYQEAHPDSYVSLYILNEQASFSIMGGGENTLASFEEQLGKMSERIRNSFAARSIYSQIEERRGNLSMQPGMEAPAFTLPDANGKAVSLADYRGKYVLLDFWASWCAPCRAENPNVLKAYNTYHAKGFEVLSVTVDNSREAWLKAVKEDQLPWTHLYDPTGFENVAARAYYIRAVPTTFLIGPDGRIVAMNLRGPALGQRLAEIFNK
jgi:peroxiredoxin